jgi:hypothetical protein
LHSYLCWGRRWLGCGPWFVTKLTAKWHFIVFLAVKF